MRCWKRITLPSGIYYSDPIHAIKSLIGDSATIVRHIALDVILSNSYVIVDVEYEVLTPNPLVTYYVNTTDLVKCSPDSTSGYTFKFEGSDVWFRTSNPRIMQSKKIIPVTILPLDKESVAAKSMFGDRIFRYVANHESNPLHEYSSLKDMRRYRHSEINFDELLKSDLAKVKRKEIYDEKVTKDKYFELIQRPNGILSTTELKYIKTWNDVRLDESNVGYLLDVDLLPDIDINGIILVCRQRKSSIVFYYPHNSALITKEQIHFVKNLCMVDRLINLPPDE